MVTEKITWNRSVWAYHSWSFVSLTPFCCHPADIIFSPWKKGENHCWSAENVLMDRLYVGITKTRFNLLVNLLFSKSWWKLAATFTFSLTHSTVIDGCCPLIPNSLTFYSSLFINFESRCCLFLRLREQRHVSTFQLSNCRFETKLIKFQVILFIPPAWQ